jgi:uncharacterized protein YoxC
MGFAISAFSNKPIVPKAKNDLICIILEKRLKQKRKTINHVCKKCGGNLEEIKGILNRHPDLISKVNPQVA